ncbi:MAG TPA: nucleotidyltransferase family protein [Acidimicrobiia bacterium]|nr:nucleotidyltransferase family protein [Acidimicrobiia bacterium]
MERVDELRAILHGSDWFCRVLANVAALDLPDCWVGAGAVRDLVWDVRFGAGFDPADIVDVDVVFFDGGDLSAEREEQAEAALRVADPSVKWDVKNQARVHLWFEARFGAPAEPLASAFEGVATWPERASAVAVRLDGEDEIDVLAPFGLDDLLDGVWRRNPTRVTEREWQARLDRKQPGRRWPAVTVV